VASLDAGSSRTMTEQLRIGWTGVMGAPMAGHLLDAGHHVSVFNRTPERADALVRAGKVLESMRSGALLVDMTTSEPSLALEIHHAAGR
jgi:3-hydroxyisobutyrate dehydrogenase-like beta-hydroxyacid dehydrogenase